MVFMNLQVNCRRNAVNETAGFIAVGSYCVVSIGFFFRAALAHRDVLVDFGNPKQELSAGEMGPGPHPFARPRDPERLLIAKLLTMMAMRFLTAHEMTHILNGHLRYRLGGRSRNTIAEARQMLSPKEAPSARLWKWTPTQVRWLIVCHM
jgi:hypothetical protein